jgi:hypothetical protein
MASPPNEEHDRARAFVNGVARISNRWGQQSLSELRESPIDDPTRRSLAHLARRCNGLLEEGAHPALDALIALDPEIRAELDPDQVEVRSKANPLPDFNKEEVLNWINLVADGLQDLYELDDEHPALKVAPSNPTITVKLPRGDQPTSSRLARSTQGGARKSTSDDTGHK